MNKIKNALREIYTILTYDEPDNDMVSNLYRYLEEIEDEVHKYDMILSGERLTLNVCDSNKGGRFYAIGEIWSKNGNRPAIDKLGKLEDLYEEGKE